MRPGGRSWSSAADAASATAGPGPSPRAPPSAARRPRRPPSARSAEETGLRVRITGPLDDIEYWFVQSGTRIHKTVHYFMMEPTGGDLAGHDHEFDQVRWIDFSEATAVLTFETERALVARAADVLAASPDPALAAEDVRERAS